MIHINYRFFRAAKLRNFAAFLYIINNKIVYILNENK